jgi:APA family basic amino acid/polyamine antiporter
LGALSRRVSLHAATALVVGGTVGVGIFLTMGGMAGTLASPALLFGVWAFMGGCALCGALCYGELAARYPEAGGGYVYLREAFGKGVAFLYGWKCLLVMDPGLTATLATGLGANAHAAWPTLPEKGTAIAAVLLVAGANVLGVSLASGIGYGFGVAKVGLLAVLIAMGFLSETGDASRITPIWERATGAPPLVPALAGAVISAFFAFGGWWETSKLAGEIRDPQRNLPRALTLGVVTITLIYIGVSAAFLNLLPPDAAGSEAAFASRVGEALFGPAGGTVFAAVVALSLLGTLFAFMTSAPRVYYAMGQDGVVPGIVGRLDPRTGVPVYAIMIQAALSVLLILVGTFETIMAYFVFATVVFLGLTVFGLFRIRGRSRETAYVAPLFPATAIVFLVSVALVLVLLAAGRPLQAALGMAVVALGIPVYRFALERAR